MRTWKVKVDVGHTMARAHSLRGSRGAFLTGGEAERASCLRDWTMRDVAGTRLYRRHVRPVGHEPYPLIGNSGDRPARSLAVSGACAGPARGRSRVVLTCRMLRSRSATGSAAAGATAARTPPARRQRAAATRSTGRLSWGSAHRCAGKRAPSGGGDPRIPGAAPFRGHATPRQGPWVRPSMSLSSLRHCSKSGCMSVRTKSIW